MHKYKNYEAFYSLNKLRFDAIQSLAAKLKSPKDLSANGMVLAEAEELEHAFLTGVNACTDLLFGLSASVLDAQANVNSVEGLLYSQKTGGATDKNRAVQADALYIDAVRHFNELEDLKKYLSNKREDFTANHYFYKSFRKI